MRTENFVKGLLLASIMSFSSIVVADENDTTPKEEQTIILVGDNNGSVNDKTHKVPVTATFNYTESREMIYNFAINNNQ